MKTSRDTFSASFLLKKVIYYDIFFIGKRDNRPSLLYNFPYYNI